MKTSWILFLKELDFSSWKLVAGLIHAQAFRNFWPKRLKFYPQANQLFFFYFLFAILPRIRTSMFMMFSTKLWWLELEMVRQYEIIIKYSYFILQFGSVMQHAGFPDFFGFSSFCHARLEIFRGGNSSPHIFDCCARFAKSVPKWKIIYFIVVIYFTHTSAHSEHLFPVGGLEERNGAERAATFGGVKSHLESFGLKLWMGKITLSLCPYIVLLVLLGRNLNA